MKTLVKKVISIIIPKRIRHYILLAYSYKRDIDKYYKYATFAYRKNTYQMYKSLLTYNYHVIEKGLTMPETRFGFGYTKISAIVDLCNLYIKDGYSKDGFEFQHSIQILNEYLEFHRNNNYQIDEEIQKSIIELQKKTNIYISSSQLNFNKEVFFKDTNSSFDKFCNSRHTVRNYTTEDISIDVFHNCVELAQKSPSACNRQPSRVYIVKNKEKIKKILSLQNGNRGFGELANALVVFTVDISAFRGREERNEPYLNSGMFIMSFIYALHFYNVGSCALNWSVKNSIDAELQNYISIPQNEKISLILSCGYVPNSFSVAESPKLGWDKITKDIL